MKNKGISIQKLKKVASLPQVELVNLDKHLKPEQMPLVDASPLGRHRLLESLKNRYGPMFRNVRGVSNILKEYDIQVKSIKDLYGSMED
jgi:hypothetical protein